jgi:hypothetical protein
MPSGWKGQYLRYKELFIRLINQYRKRPDFKMFLELFLSIVTITIFSVFALRPTVLTIIQLLKDINTKEETIKAMDTKIENLAKAQNIFNQSLQTISLVKSSIPDQASPEGFVTQIEGLAIKHQTKVLGVSIGEVVLIGDEKEKKAASEIKDLPENAKGLSFSISVSGSFSSIINFLSDLEKLRRPINIDVLGINSSQKEGGKILVLVVSGRTPYFKGKIIKQ